MGPVVRKGNLALCGLWATQQCQRCDFLSEASSSYPVYRNDPKFSDRYAWANSADTDQTLLEEE